MSPRKTKNQKTKSKDKNNSEASDKGLRLREAGDVLKRLRTASSSSSNLEDTNYNSQNVLVGYEDRFLGPMERRVADFPMADNQSGDIIPEHRIYYFRMVTESVPSANDILWDRRGRVDKIFHHSGRQGPEATIDPITFESAQRAYHTMIRVQEEQKHAQDIVEGNDRAQKVRRELAARILTEHKQEPILRQTSDLRRKLEAQGIDESDNEPAVVVDDIPKNGGSRKRPLEQLLQRTNQDDDEWMKDNSLDRVNRMRLEAIFHPKFENENCNDSFIRKTMLQKVDANQGYLEVSLKHSGSLLLWSGGQRYYSKNSTDNKFTHVGEILLRQHFVRAFWDPSEDALTNVIHEAMYYECSNYVESERLTLAFEVVTSVLGDHGDKPHRDFLILTAVADRSSERFYSTTQILELAQRFRLPHNDFWQFSSIHSAQKLFQFYDSCRETSLATTVQATLSQSAEKVIRSLYPHVDFQGDILEGIVIRYVSNKDDNPDVMRRMDALAQAADDLLKKVPSTVPDCFHLVKQMNCPLWLSADLRQIYSQCRLSSNKESFAEEVAKILGSDNRRKGCRLPKNEADHVPSLMRNLRQSEDVETRRIAHLVQTLSKLNIRVDYSVIKEEIMNHGFSRWLCIIHVLLDHSHQKYRKNMAVGDLTLFRGFALELSTAGGFSANEKLHVSGATEADSDSDSSDPNIILMLKMKFLPYMVRTFGCRNGLKNLKDGGRDGFVRYTSNLLNSWGMSVNAKNTWMPFFRAWAEYAEPRLAKRLPEDGDLPQLTAENYLDHLERFIPLYESGKIGVESSGAFRGFCVVVGPREETANETADLIAKQVGCKVRYRGVHSVPGGPQEGVVCSVSIEEKHGRFMKMLGDHGSVIFVGCSDQDIDALVGDDVNKGSALKGRLKGWKKLEASFQVDLSLSSLLTWKENGGKEDGEKQGSNEAIVSKEILDVIERLKGPLPEESESALGLLVFFPQIPGCGKSSLVDDHVEEVLNKFLAEKHSSRKRKLTIRMGDKTKGKYWPLVKKEKKEHINGLYIADKNVPSTSWDLIANVCAETSAIGVPVLPGNAIETTVVKGIRWPNSGEVSMNRTHTFPFSLRYLAVCMLRVVSRPPNSHPGKLDSSTGRACMIVVMFFCLYENVSGDEFMDSLTAKFNRESAILARESIEVPFFRSNDGECPDNLKALLTEAIQAQCGYKTKNVEIGKVKDPYLDDLELRLRKCLKENSEFLNSLTVGIEESQKAFLNQIENAVVKADSGNMYQPFSETTLEEGGNSKPKFIDYVSIQVSPDEVHQFLLEHVDDSRSESFWHIVSGKNPVQEVLRGSRSTDKRLILDTHITMAHKNDYSQQEMLEKFGFVEGHEVNVTIVSLLWDDQTAALKVQLAGKTCEGSTLPPSKNSFTHITIWCQNGTRAFRSNELPNLVKKGLAHSINFKQGTVFSGKVSL